MTEPTFAGKSMMVTGGGSGIGRATSLLLAECGAQVTVIDIVRSAAEETRDLIEANGGSAIVSIADVSVFAHLVDAVADAERRFGRLDGVAANAGYAAFPKPADQISEDEFDRVMTINVKGAWNTARAALPALRRAGGGAIVLTGSIMGERARAGQAAYASSKAAVNHLARVLALDFAPDRIRVNAVAPVATDTAMLPAFLGPDSPETAREAFIAGIPLGRLAEPDDVARAIRFLLSDDAEFITGAVLGVDGGRGI